MILRELNILNYKNIREATLCFSDKLNCLIGLNGQGKTNVLDAIYLLSFTKSAISLLDSQNICNEADMAMVQGKYKHQNEQQEEEVISCGLKRGQKKQFRRGKKDYKRLMEHIGLIPLVMVSPEDSELIAEGSDERRRFMDGVISQRDNIYLERLTNYNALLKQRNALLKQLAETSAEHGETDTSVLEVYEIQMQPLAEYIYQQRSAFVEAFVPVFQSIYEQISGGKERVKLKYVSQLQDRDLGEAYLRTRQRDMILGWTSQGIHKDELEMLLQLPGMAAEEEGLPLKRVGSQGQQKTYLMAMKLAQAVYLSRDNEQPILLLDDIFDKLDSQRVERIVQLVLGPQFGQIFLTDTNRQHLSQLLAHRPEAKLMYVEAGAISDGTADD